MENKKELNLDQIEKVTGGYVLNDAVNKKYGVIKQDGALVAPAPTLEKAKEYAKAYDVSLTEMTPEQYKEHFGRELKW